MECRSVSGAICPAADSSQSPSGGDLSGRLSNEIRNGWNCMRFRLGRVTSHTSQIMSKPVDPSQVSGIARRCIGPLQSPRSIADGRIVPWSSPWRDRAFSTACRGSRPLRSLARQRCAEACGKRRLERPLSPGRDPTPPLAASWAHQMCLPGCPGRLWSGSSARERRAGVLFEVTSTPTGHRARPAKDAGSWVGRRRRSCDEPEGAEASPVADRPPPTASRGFHLAAHRSASGGERRRPEPG